MEPSADILLNKDPLQPLLPNREAPIDSRDLGSASIQAKCGLVPSFTNSSWDKSAMGKRNLESSPIWSCWPFLHLLALWDARPDRSSIAHPPLTVAVGEVEVPLGTGIAVLPGVVGLAVTAASEVLTGAVGEVRLTVTACREGQASSGCHWLRPS